MCCFVFIYGFLSYAVEFCFFPLSVGISFVCDVCFFFHMHVDVLFVYKLLVYFSACMRFSTCKFPFIEILCLFSFTCALFCYMHVISVRMQVSLFFRMPLCFFLTYALVCVYVGVFFVCELLLFFSVCVLGFPSVC